MPKVFATGFMTVLMEWACTQLLAPHLDPGEGSLGVYVECIEVTGPRVSFKVKAHDGIDLIGEGPA
jgi:fluoroacetyl-CoA thioesterase